MEQQTLTKANQLQEEIKQLKQEVDSLFMVSRAFHNERFKPFGYRHADVRINNNECFVDAGRMEEFIQNELKIKREEMAKKEMEFEDL